MLLPTWGTERPRHPVPGAHCPSRGAPSLEGGAGALPPRTDAGLHGRPRTRLEVRPQRSQRRAGIPAARQGPVQGQHGACSPAGMGGVLTPAEKHEGRDPPASPAALSSPGENLTTALLFMKLMQSRGCWHMGGSGRELGRGVWPHRNPFHWLHGEQDSRRRAGGEKAPRGSEGPTMLGGQHTLIQGPWVPGAFAPCSLGGVL